MSDSRIYNYEVYGLSHDERVRVAALEAAALLYSRNVNSTVVLAAAKKFERYIKEGTAE